MVSPLTQTPPVIKITEKSTTKCHQDERIVCHFPTLRQPHKHYDNMPKSPPNMPYAKVVNSTVSLPIEGRISPIIFVN